MNINAQDMPLSDMRNPEQSVERPQSAKPVACHKGGHRDGHSFCTYKNAFGPGDLHRGSQVPSMERHGQGYPERPIHQVMCAKITLHYAFHKFLDRIQINYNAWLDSKEREIPTSRKKEEIKTILVNVWTGFAAYSW